MSSRQPSLSIVEYFAEHSGYRCGYCGQEDTNYSHGMWGHTLTTEDYQDLIDRGWRRSGQYCYKPTMDKTCCPLYTIKCEALQFKPTKSQKKVVKKFVNYIINDVRPGGGGGSSQDNESKAMEGENEDCGVSDDVQSRTERLESNLKFDLINSEAPKVAKVENDESIKNENLVKPVCDKPENTSKFTTSRGMDPDKPRQGKAKLRRIEKSKSKHGEDVPLRPTPKNQEKSIEDLMQPLETSANPKHKWELKLVPVNAADKTFSASFSETVSVYQKYQQVIHNDSPDKCTEKQFKRFLCNSPLQTDAEGPPFGSFHYQYWIDERIAAVGVLDILPHCVSSVYLYYDPHFAFLSPGTLTSLLEICLVRKLAKTYPSITNYYLGFYIHNCVKMKYKGRYAPSSLLCPEVFTWHPLASCTSLLDVSSYSRLEPDTQKVDREAAVDLDQVGVLYCRQATFFSFYRSLLLYQDKETDEDRDKEEVVEYSSLVGNTLAKRMLLYRPPE